MVFAINSIYIVHSNIIVKLNASKNSFLIVSIIFSVISIGISWIAGIESSKYSVEIVQNMIAHTVYNGRIFRGMIFIPIGMCFNFKKYPINIEYFNYDK